MLEGLCQDALAKLCRDEIGEDRLVFLKNRATIQKREFQGFMGDNWYRFNWNVIPVELFHNKRKDSLARLSWVWFNENADKIASAYIRERYGDTKTAMRATGSFDNLYMVFKDDFAYRRRKVMKHIDKQLATQQAGLKKAGKSPQSHGGVANLLKVLTKTMHDQGSSVYSIAKVQYAVCMQAGIYIPEEFLTDVLVAGEMMEEQHG